MSDPLRILTGLTTGDENTDPHLTQEWLVTNGLGGYASGTVVGPNTRRYHGLLVAGLPNPLGRFLMLQTLSEQSNDDLLHPSEFRLEAGLPVWLYKTNAGTLEKRVHLPHKQNTVYITYKLLDGLAA